MDNPNQCQVCAKVYDYEVRHHSGVRECQVCWDWRKLNGPMARYWSEKIEALFEQGPDHWDIETWRRMEMCDEMIDALNVLEAFRVRCEIAINASEEDRRSALGYTKSEMSDKAKQWLNSQENRA